MASIQNSPPLIRGNTSGLTSTQVTDASTEPKIRRLSFELDDRGRPLSERQLHGLSYPEWIAFNLKHCATTVYRTFKWIKVLIILKRNGITPESIREINRNGGIISKILQAIGSSDELISSVCGISKVNPNFQAIKQELCTSMHDNEPMPMRKLISILNENNFDYDPDRLNEITILGVGSVGQVIQIPMRDGTTKVVKVVDSDLEIKFKADISIVSTILSLVSRFKPDIVGRGSTDAIRGFLSTIPREFDLRYEKHNTQIQQRRFQRLDQDFYHITADDCRCSESDHGYRNTNCHNYLGTRPRAPQHYINVDGKNVEIEYSSPAIDEDLSSRNMLVMEEIDGVTLSSSDDDFLTKVVQPLLVAHNQTMDRSRISPSMINALRQEIRNCAFSAWEQGLFTAGECSADMHNGNIMVSIEGKKIIIHFIDFGNYVNETRDTVVSIYTAVSAIDKAMHTQNQEHINSHADALIGALRQFGIPTRDTINWDAIKREAITEFSNPENGGNPNKVVTKVFDIGFRHGLRVPPSIIGLFRARLILTQN
ncbi:hypothetical protein GCM10023116_23030 [Kistimonas scapharcae]|uniref:ABC1 atypical kinase-like domain-containing protein n=2 Tax=Kistimonas scapharcae TaxID=1036133 RepID=A0ABP8V407_9GAMM